MIDETQAVVLSAAPCHSVRYFEAGCTLDCTRQHGRVGHALVVHTGGVGRFHCRNILSAQSDGKRRNRAVYVRVFKAPTIGAATTSLLRSQASAIVAWLTPRSLAIPLTASTIF